MLHAWFANLRETENPAIPELQASSSSLNLIRRSPIHPAASENESMEAHPTGAAIPPPPIAAPQPPPSTTTTPPPIAEPQEPTAAAVAVAVTTVRSPHTVRFTFLVVAALMSASWFIEPFAAAADLRVPWPAVVVTLVCFAAFFCASVLLFGSFFMLRPPPGAAAVMAAQWKGVRAVAVVFAAVLIGVATCLVAAGGSAYGYGGMRQLVAE